MKPVTAAEWSEKVLKASNVGPVLIVFGATWCGPCKALKAAVDKLEGEFKGTMFMQAAYEVDIDVEPTLARKFQVKGVPTVIVMRSGAVQARAGGAPPSKDALIRMLRGDVD